MSETLQESSVPSDSIAEELPKARESSDRSAEDLLVQEGDIAGDYLEQLLDLLDYDGDIDLDVDAGRAVVSIEGGEDLEKLVGPRGSVLEALQELTRLAVQQETGARSRLMLDVAGWRAARREELRELGRSAAEQAVKSGEQVEAPGDDSVRAEGGARRGRVRGRRAQRERGRGAPSACGGLRQGVVRVIEDAARFT